MFKPIKRILIAATVTVAMSTPSIASAYPIQAEWGSSTSSAPSSVASDSLPGVTQALGVFHRSESQPTAQPPIVSATSHVAASSSHGFQWGDAGIGAASVIVLLGAGAATVGVMRQRRAHRPVTG